MKPAPVRYARPDSVEEACSLLRVAGARVLAGGQSLVPSMTTRSARPDLLVDLAGVPDLDRLDVVGDHLVVGAMVRQAAIERSDTVRGRCPLLAMAVAHVGHAQIRSQRTVVGSIVHDDPAAEIPAAFLALGGSLMVSWPDGVRTVSADALVPGGRWTLPPGELVVAARFPLDRVAVGFAEFAIRHHDLPECAVAVVAAAPAPTIVFATPLGRRRLDTDLLGSVPQDQVPSVVAAAVGDLCDAALAAALVRRAVDQAQEAR